MLRFLMRAAVICVYVSIFMLSLTTPSCAAPIEGLEFNHLNQSYVQFSNNLEGFPGTVEMWVKIPNTGSRRQIILGGYSAGSIPTFSLELTVNGEMRYYENPEADYNVISFIVTGVDVRTDEWTHLVFIRDYSQQKLTWIINGVSYQTNANFPQGSVLSENHFLGTDHRKDFYLSGLISEVRLWSDIRTTWELAEYASSELTGNEEGLMHCWAPRESMLDGFLNIVPDVKAGGINGIASGFPAVEYVSPFTGNGVDFSGGDIEIVSSRVLPQAPKTFEAWVNIPKDFPADQRPGIILGNYFVPFNSDNAMYSFDIHTNGNPRLYWQTEELRNKQFRATDVNMCIGDWVHMAMVMDEMSEKVTCYVNGVKVAETHETIPNVIPPQPLKIGGDYRGEGSYYNEQYFKGRIADVRIWSTVRTEQEIRESMTQNLSGNEVGLLGNWLLESEEGGVYRDNSVQGNDAYIYHQWIRPARFANGDYSIAVIPDLQHLTEKFPDVLEECMLWIRDNADTHNIKFAIQVGDLVNKNQAEQWEVVSDGLELLDGVVPYVFVPGNHDYTIRDTTLMNTYLPYGKYSINDSFGGAFEPGKMDNTYHYFSAGGLHYMVLCLEFAPRDEVLEWANQIVAANPECKVIVATHGYLYYNGKHLDESCKGYNTSVFAAGNNGDDIWEKFVKLHKNIVLVLCGHIPFDDLIMRTDTGFNGNIVRQILCDSQYMDNRMGGTGMIMLMTFRNGSRDVSVNYYSTRFDAMHKALNQFDTTLDIADYGINYNPITNAVTISAGSGAAYEAAVLVMAGYDCGRLIEMYTKTIDFSETSAVCVTPTAEEFSADGTDEIRVFLWNRLNDIIPLCANREINLK